MSDTPSLKRLCKYTKKSQTRVNAVSTKRIFLLIRGNLL